ncbi:hypothetical protein F7734_40920 [Scytonema sp. UIC 10036]|uniref:hypothetical protein n=1 Tax=Scytonema sp. UIC 10036 TaxID=2304196 RepID=UPI0012DA83D7|nr:hypothetical protein [Scytonema sp. UIC 10036]MUG98332.1 hypothetical protein [Scytonema sp. UIC 10036]
MAKIQVEKELSHQDKISAEFTHRLRKLNPHQVVRVLVLLNLNNNKINQLSNSQKFSNKHISAVKNLRKLEKQALNDIHKIMQDNDGKLLAEHFNLLGSIPIEITVAGVYQLATLDVVKAVIEDQEIYPLK